MWYCPLATTQRPRFLILAEERGLHVRVVLLEGEGRASAVAMDAIEKKGSALGACRSGTATQTLSPPRRRELSLVVGMQQL